MGVESEVKESVFAGRFIFPVEITVKAKKVGEDLWEIHYSERIELKDKALLQKSVEDTKRAFQAMGRSKFKLRGSWAFYTLKAPFSVVASMIVTEFLTASALGDLTLRDVISMAGLYAGLQKPVREKINEYEAVASAPVSGRSGMAEGASCPKCHTLVDPRFLLCPMCGGKVK